MVHFIAPREHLSDFPPGPMTTITFVRNFFSEGPTPQHTRETSRGRVVNETASEPARFVLLASMEDSRQEVRKNSARPPQRYWYLFMLSCLILASSVERGIPSLAAAPPGPATLP